MYQSGSNIFSDHPAVGISMMSDICVLRGILDSVADSCKDFSAGSDKNRQKEKVTSLQNLSFDTIDQK